MTNTTTCHLQLEADLATGIRGGNKYRLIARCWVAARYGADCGMDATDYDRFRAEWGRQTFLKIHEAFDQLLPLQFRADTRTNGCGQRKANTAKQANGLTEAQQKQFNRFCNAPARLAKQFNKRADYFLGCGDTEKLQATAERYQDAAAYCQGLVGNIELLTGLWNLGMRTGGDLENQIDRTLRG